MHYEKAPPAEGRGRMWRPPPLRCLGASLRCGGAWGVTAVVYAVGRTAEGHPKALKEALAASGFDCTTVQDLCRKKRFLAVWYTQCPQI